MRVGKSLLSLTYTSVINPITANRFVGFDGEQATVAGQKVAGVAEYGQLVGTPYSATAKGTAWIEAAGAIAIGDSLVSDNVGRATQATPLKIATGAVAMTSVAANGAGDIAGSQTPEFYVGEAISAASAAGQFVEILLK
jgi:hypothetical protein